MLDIHPPQHAIHGVRDFLLHLLTITVGLLIALGLENAVEALHHRNLRKEAQIILHQEIQNNQTKLSGMLKGSAATRDNITRALQYIQDRRDGKTGNAAGITFAFSSGPLASAGWKTALATGTLSLMEPPEVQRYAGAYQEQQLFEDAQARALEHIERLGSYVTNADPAKISVRDLTEALPDVRAVIADLSAMQDIGRGTLEAYGRILESKQKQ